MFDDDILGAGDEEEEYDSDEEMFIPEEEIRGVESYLEGERGLDREQALQQEVGGEGSGPSFDLVRDALAGGLGPSQEMYELLGNLLAEKRANRQQRAIIRKARRILEQSFGLDAVRKTVAPASSSYTRVPTPQMDQRSDGGFTGPALVVHRFDRKQRRIRGGGTRQYFAPGTTYTGFDAVTRAVGEHRQTLQNRLTRLTEERAKLERGRGGPTVERRKRLLSANIEAAKSELTQYAEPGQGRTRRRAGLKVPETPVEVAQMMVRAGAQMGPVKTYLASTGMGRGEIRTVLPKVFGGADRFAAQARSHIERLEEEIRTLKKSSSADSGVVKSRILLLTEEIRQTRRLFRVSGKPTPRTQAVPQSPVKKEQELVRQYREEERQQKVKGLRMSAEKVSAPLKETVDMGDRIIHTKYGPGKVTSKVGTRLGVEFDDGKKKKLQERFLGIAFRKA